MNALRLNITLTRCKVSICPAPWPNVGLSKNPRSMDALAKNKEWINENSFMKYSFPTEQKMIL